MTLVMNTPMQHVDALGGHVLGAKPLVDHVRLDEALAPRRDRRADDADDREHVGAVERALGHDQVVQRRAPDRAWRGWPRRCTRADTSTPMATKPYWTRLNDPAPMSVITAIAATIARQRRGHAEQRERRADAGELRHRRAKVGDDHRQRRERRPAQAEALADQPGQALAGRETEARADLLGDQQRELGHEDDPQQARSRSARRRSSRS